MNIIDDVRTEIRVHFSIVTVRIATNSVLNDVVVTESAVVNFLVVLVEMVDHESVAVVDFYMRTDEHHRLRRVPLSVIDR